jgi:hypothetical protein
MLDAVPMTKAKLSCMNVGTLSKKVGTPLNVLINSNLGVVEGRMIRQGDKIAVR